MIKIIKGKIALVTGAGRGIGKACASILAENGATVIINYNDSGNQAKKLAAELKNAELIKADVSKEIEVKAMFNEIKEKYGKLDILVNNAGIMKNALLMMSSVKDFDAMVDINCKGSFLCARYAANLMMKNKSGKIINFSSILGKNGAPGQSVYSGTKGFIIGFTKALAKELGRYNIQVNAIAPGIVDTDMIKSLKEETIKSVIDNIPLGRMGLPEDVAKVVLFLSSNQSNYVSGQIIGVDGSQVI